MDKNLQAVIVDLGECYTKIGKDKDEVPRAVLPSVFATTEEDVILCGVEGGRAESAHHHGFETYFGVNADRREGILAQRRLFDEDRRLVSAEMLGLFVHHAMVENFDTSETNNKGVIVLGKPYASTKMIREMAEVMLDWNKFERFLLLPDFVASLYSTGKSTGTVLSCGFRSTYAASVLSGHSSPFSIVSTAELSASLVERDYGRILRDVQYELKRRGLCGRPAPLHRETRLFLEKNAIVAHENASAASQQVVLPDGSSFELETRELTRPFDSYFTDSPRNPSAAELILDSAARCSAMYKEQMLANIVVEGGISLAANFVNRLQDCLTAKLSAAKPKVLKSGERDIVAYSGAVRLKEWLDDHKVWLKKENLDERGLERVYHDITNIF